MATPFGNKRDIQRSASNGTPLRNQSCDVVLFTPHAWQAAMQYDGGVQVLPRC